MLLIENQFALIAPAMKKTGPTPKGRAGSAHTIINTNQIFSYASGSYKTKGIPL